MQGPTTVRRRSRRPALSRADERELALLEMAESLLAEGRLAADAGRHAAHRGQDAAERLAVHLAWMTERNLSVLGRERPSREQLLALADELAEVWLAAGGHAD